LRIQLLHVSKTFPPRQQALADINLEIGERELVFISGPSGAGKSTLLKLLFRELESSEGEILIDGRNVTRLSSRGVARLRRKMGLVFQEFRFLPALSVIDNVALAAQVLGVSKKQSRVKAYQLLKELGLKDRYDAKPFMLSAGEQQRVAIARALINDPSLVIADEPTGNIDEELADGIMQLFLKIRDRGATVVIATHHRVLMERYGARVIKLERGFIIDGSSGRISRPEYTW
jgi:cell division transport system ATP-binding protein